MHRHTGSRYSAVLLLVLSAAACGDSPTVPAAVAAVAVAPDTATLEVGQTGQLTVILRDAAGNILTGREVEWSSSNQGVATVSQQGLITAVAQGKATITASSEGRSGTAQVTVVPVPVASVVVAPDTATLEVGQTGQLTAILRDAAGNILTGREVEWSSSNQGVATVSQQGLITAVAQGKATITASSEGRSGTAQVTVVPVPVASVVVAPDTATLEVGQTGQLTAILRDAAGNILTGREVEWSSSNQGVATVSQQGLITAVAQGKATITASSEGRSGTAQVTVVPVPVASVVVAPDTATLEVGQTGQLTAILRDAAGNILTGREVEWSSSNQGVATVSQQGLITAVAQGKATITASSEGRSGTAQVTVVPVPVASVVVAPDTATLEVGQTGQLTAILRDAAGNILTGREVEWSSSNQGVATVSQQGLITAVAQGKATITASSEGRSGTAQVTVVPVPTDVGGVITTNTAWTLANSPYRIVQNVQIAYGAMLTIHPGVTVLGEGKSIETWGVLSAVGTAAQPVMLSTVRIVPRGRNTEAFLIRLEHVELRGGSLYAPTGSQIYGSLKLTDSRLFDLESYMYIWYPLGDSFIERNVFIRTGGISVGADTRGSPVRVFVRNNLFQDWRDTFGRDFAVESWASYGGETIILHRNSFMNTNRIAARVSIDGRLSAVDNFWNTTSEAVIQSMIYDRSNDLNAPSYIEFRPFLTHPHPDTPSPGSPPNQSEIPGG
jgi:uncharacterized protein YjdB